MPKKRPEIYDIGDLAADDEDPGNLRRRLRSDGLIVEDITWPDDDADLRIGKVLRPPDYDGSRHVDD